MSWKTRTCDPSCAIVSMALSSPLNLDFRGSSISTLCLFIHLKLFLQPTQALTDFSHSTSPLKFIPFLVLTLERETQIE